MNRGLGDALQKLTDQFNSSQSDVKVNLVNQIDYVQTFTKYKAGLSTGDLPDIVQLQETEQQQMIDTGTVLPASVCAKADKYSFSDFLPRVISYFTVDGTQYAMPFNTSGPVLLYNKKAFTAAGLDPEQAADQPRRGARGRREAQDRRRAGAARAQDRARVLRALARDGEQALREQQQRAQGTRHQDHRSTTPPAVQIFSWLSGMVKDGLAETNPDLGTGNFDNLLGIQSGSHAMAFDTSAVLGTVTAILGSGRRPTSSSASHRSPAREPARSRAACW